MVEGSKDTEHLRQEHPVWVERMENEGHLSAALVPVVPLFVRVLHFVTGYALIALGVFLLLYAIINITCLALAF